MEEGNQSNSAKIIQLDEYDRTLGTDELNLAEFPLAVLATRTDPGQNTLLFEDTIYDEGARAPVQRSLVIAGSDHFGLPTAIDSDILLVLVHLSNVRNGFKSRRVEFSRYELIKFLGWGQEGKSYTRLEESLQRWASVTLHYKHAWWFRSKQRWASRSFHVLETLELRAKDEIHDDGLSSFTWNEVIFDSFNAGNLRRINLDTYFSLSYAASKQMFRFLGKRFYRSAKLQFDLRQFAVEHIGLSRRYDIFDLKRKLAPAIEELVAIGFLTPLSPEACFRKLSPGNWEVTFIKGAKSVSAESDSPLTKDLVTRGVSTKVAKDLCAKFTPEHVAEKIALHDDLVAVRDKRVSRNAAGFLASAIMDNYQPLRRPRRVTPVSQRIPQLRAGGRIEAVEKPELDKGFSEYWETLPMEERARIERDALDAAPSFHKKTIERLESANSTLRNPVRMKLIRDYLKRTNAY